MASISGRLPPDAAEVSIVSLQLHQKQALVEEMAAVVARTPSIVAADYSGMTVPQMTRLRAEARAADVYLRVVKNNLFKRALQGTRYEALSDEVRGRCWSPAQARN